MVLPYLKGLVIIKCGFFYLALWIYCVFNICGDYICRSIQVLNTMLVCNVSSSSNCIPQGDYYKICDIIPEKWLNVGSENNEILFDKIL
jgi:hypothetical protein